MFLPSNRLSNTTKHLVSAHPLSALVPPEISQAHFGEKWSLEVTKVQANAKHVNLNE